VGLWPGITAEILAVDYLDFPEEQLGRARERQLVRYLLSAQATADRFCRRTFGPDPALTDSGADTNPPVTKIVRVGVYDDSVKIPDLRIVPDPVVTLDGLSLALDSDFDLEPYSSERPATFVRLAERPSAQGGALSITGRFGWNPLPADLDDAIYTLAARRYRERQSNHADSVQLPEGLTLAYFRQLPASVQGTLMMLKIHHFAVVGG
jgi:hypothetical protein